MAPFPVSFNVAEHSSKASTSSSTLDHDRFKQLGQENEAKALKQLRLDVGLTVQLAESDNVTQETLRDALSSLHVGTWLDIVQERHLLGRCGYPTCTNAPSRAYNHNKSTPQFKLTSSGKLLDYADKAPFCSAACLRRAKFLERNSIPQRSGLLWEDVALGDPSSGFHQPRATSISPLLQDGAPPSSPGSNDLIANLPIVERPTETSSVARTSLASFRGNIHVMHPNSLSCAAQPGQADFEARSYARGIPRPQQQRRNPASNSNSPRRFILNKRMRTRAAGTPPLSSSSSPTPPSSAGSATTDRIAQAQNLDDDELPSLESLSLYDQAIGSAGGRGADNGGVQDDMNDQERAIWMLGRNLRDQLRASGELD